MTSASQPRGLISARPQFEGRLARSMVAALLAFSLVPLLLMGSAAYLRARYLLREQVAAQLQTTTQGYAEQVEQSIHTMQVRLDRIVRLHSFSSQLEIGLSISRTHPNFSQAREKIIEEFSALNTLEGMKFNQFFVIQPDGAIQVASRQEWEGQRLENAPQMEKYLEEDIASFGIYGLAPLYTDQYVILVTKQYHDQNGNLRGTVIAVLESKSAQLMLESAAALLASSNAYLVTDQNVFVGIDPYKRELTKFEPSEEQRGYLQPALAAQMAGNEQETGLIEFTNASGKAVIAKTLWLASLDTGIVDELPQEAVFGPLNSLAPFTAFLMLATLGTMVIVIWTGTNRFVKPLLALAETTRRFSEGDWRERSPIQRNDELGYLAYSFNQMADDLSEMYRSLEFQVDERTRQIRTAAEVAQGIASAFNLAELLQKTAALIVERFGYYHAGIFLVDRAGKNAVLQAACGPAAEQMLGRGHKLAIGSQSIIGWVSSNNQPRVASDVAEDPMHLKNELMPETRAEVGMPISSGSQVLGVLDVQSTEPRAFDAETIVVLQTLANQIAAAIQNVTLMEAAQVDLRELERLYRASRQIMQAQTENEILEATGHVLKETPYVAAVFAVRESDLEMVSYTDADREEAEPPTNRQIEASPNDIANQLAGGPAIVDLSKPSHLPTALIKMLRQADCWSAAFLPVTWEERLYAVIALGARQKDQFAKTSIQPYVNVVELATTALEKVAAATATDRRLAELEALSTIAQAISRVSDLPSFFAALHEQIRQTIGEYDFTIALYHADIDAISIPYFYEQGKLSTVESFPLGEGLTSILIRTQQPLMLVEDAERHASALGAKMVGKPAKSWLGAPMLVGGEAIGAIIVQHLEREKCFGTEDLRFITAVVGQVAGVIYNVRLLEESRQRAIQLQTASEIARDISGSLNLDELLLKAVTFIRERFDFYHAAIFLVDPSNEYAVIREATGEAGAQMKRTGHRLGVGSKSIVGYVSGRGEPLVVNDTMKDATYYQNPLLAETRAEAALPLKVGERILGVLDVQSTRPFAFSADDIQTLNIFADQLAVAVINTELFAETQEHLSQHRLLHHVTTSAASGTTLEETLDSAVQGLQVTLGGDRVAILLVDKERKALEVKSAVGYSEEDINRVQIPIGAGITGWCAAHRKPLRVEDVNEEPRYIKVSANTRSELAIPLLYRNELLGVLNVESEQIAAYTENDEEMLGTLGGSLAAIIANARLLEQIRHQAERERMLYEVTSKIRRSTDMRTILATTAKELSKAVGAHRAQIKIAPSAEDTTGNDNKNAGATGDQE